MADQSIPTDATNQETARATLINGDWFLRNADRRNPTAFINTDPRYFADECSAAIVGGRLASVSSASADYVLVPREPTQDQLIAGNGMFHTGEVPLNIYRAMLAASPEPVPATNQAGEVDNSAIAVITRCKDIAMRQMVEARIPECGKFGEIAQNLDALLGSLATQPATSQEEAREKLQQTWDLMSSLPPLILSESEADHLIATITALATQPATSQKSDEREEWFRVPILGSSNMLGRPIEDSAPGYVILMVGQSSGPDHAFDADDRNKITHEAIPFSPAATLQEGNCPEIPDSSIAATPTPDHKAAWQALSEPLSWMHDNPRLKQYWGWNLADIANDLIDKAYPGLRSGEIVGTTETSAVHNCPACPMEPRDIGAVLHNLVGELERGDSKLDGRAHRKLADAKAALARWRPIVDAHFAAVKP